MEFVQPLVEDGLPAIMSEEDSLDAGSYQGVQPRNVLSRWSTRVIGQVLAGGREQAQGPVG